MSCGDRAAARCGWGRRTAITIGAAVLTVVGAPEAARASCTHVWDNANPQCLIRSTAGAIGSTIAGKIIDGVTWVAGAIGDGARTAGTPDITKPWFGDVYATTREIGILFACVALLLSIIYAALVRDLNQIGRTLARTLVAGLTTAMVVAIVGTANALVDELCVYVLGDGGWKTISAALRGPTKLLGKLVGMSRPTAVGMQVPAIMAILIGMAMLLVLCVIWIELLVRRVAIDLCVLLWPLAVSGSIWVGARAWTRRLIDTVTSLVLSKLFIILILKFAADALRGARSASDLLLAVGLYLLAAFAPFMVMRMIGFINGAVQPGHTSEGLRGAAVGAGVAAAMTAVKIGATVASGGSAAPALAGTAAAGATTKTAAGAGKKTGGMLAGGRTPMPAMSSRNHTGPSTSGQGHASQAGGASTPGTSPSAQTPEPTASPGGDAAPPDTPASGGEPPGRTRRPVPPPPPRPRPTPPGQVPQHLRSPPPPGARVTEGPPPPAPEPPPRRPQSWPGPRPDAARGRPDQPSRWGENS